GRRGPLRRPGRAHQAAPHEGGSSLPSPAGARPAIAGRRRVYATVPAPRAFRRTTRATPASGGRSAARLRGRSLNAARVLLPPAVSSDTRERPVVGQGLHRLAKRRPGETALQGPLPAPSSDRARDVRPSRTRDSAGAGRAGARSRRVGVLLLPLLVRG